MRTFDFLQQQELFTTSVALGILLAQRLTKTHCSTARKHSVKKIFPISSAICICWEWNWMN